MNVLFANIPFIKHDAEGRIYTGPNAGSRWPWTLPGITNYACFPFFMGYAVNYLIKHGIDAKFYDAVALKHWDYALVKKNIARFKPDVLFLETSTPLYPIIKKFAIWAKENFFSRIVFTGPHVHTYANELIQEPFVDHCVIGEYEKAALDIVRKLDKARPLYTFDLLEDINLLQGENFIPYRPMDYLDNYLEPTMNTPRLQLQVSTSRGCPFKCTYCQWPKVMNDGQYRNRQPELVIDEIRTVIDEYKNYQTKKRTFVAAIWDGVRTLKAAIQGRQILKPGIRSILFDDDTWNLGTARIIALCRGLREIGLPWTMMGRIDTSSLKMYDLMVENGCVGMRFGVESFNQRLLDNTKKNLDARKSYENIKYLITRFSNMEFHFTTMKNLPGEKAWDWENDLRTLNELKQLGARSNNVIHWQNSDCIAFPGTELWEEMEALGKADDLRRFDLYDGSSENEQKLAEFIGWLGTDYTPKYSRYSKMGAPTNMPEE